MRVESYVAKHAPSYNAVYATARPNGVLREWPETIVSRVDSAMEGGNNALMAGDTRCEMGVGKAYPLSISGRCLGESKGKWIIGA